MTVYGAFNVVRFFTQTMYQNSRHDLIVFHNQNVHCAIPQKL